MPSKGYKKKKVAKLSSIEQMALQRAYERDPDIPLRMKMIRAIDNYFDNGFNKGQAMIDAGYSKSTATSRSWQVWDRANVKNEIERRKKALAEKHEVTQEWIIERLMDHADASRRLAKYKKVDKDGTLYWDFKDATEEDLGLILGLNVEMYTDGRGEDARSVKKFKVDVANPLPALQALARHLGMLTDKVELAGEVSLVERIQQGRDRMNNENGES